MNELTLFALNLLWQTSSLALLTLGLAIVFGMLRIMNMAHGEFVMLGAFAPVVTSKLGWSPMLQIPVCIIMVGVIAWFIERVLIRHFYDRIFDSLLATWGLSILMRECVELLFGRSYQSIASPLPGTVDVLGVQYPAYRVLMMAVMVVFFAALVIWYSRSMAGVRIKAMVNNPVLARSAGINSTRLCAMTFTFGCVVSGLAGLMIAPLTRVEPTMGLDYLLRSFFALVVGGLGSLDGLLIGVTAIAGVQNVVAVLSDQTSGYLAVLLLTITLLWLRPDGLARRR